MSVKHQHGEGGLWSVVIAARQRPNEPTATHQLLQTAEPQVRWVARRRARAADWPSGTLAEANS